MTGFRIERVDWLDPRAVGLRRAMDADMAERYGTSGGPAEPVEFTAKRARALSVRAADVRATLLAVLPDGTPVGHVALRRLGPDWEIKRLIVSPLVRRAGIARALLAEVESLASRDGAPRVILQTGDKQPEAVALYERSGYSPIPIYEPYPETMPFSLCFEKPLA